MQQPGRGGRLSEEEHQRQLQERLAERRAQGLGSTSPPAASPFAATAAVVDEDEEEEWAPEHIGRSPPARHAQPAAGPQPTEQRWRTARRSSEDDYPSDETGRESPETRGGGRLSSRHAATPQPRICSSEYLQEEVERRKQRKQALTAEAHSREREECTFRPRTNRDYVPRSQHYLGTFERLSRDMKEEYRRRDEQRRIRDEDECKRQCPFQPRITPNSEAYASARRQCSGQMEDLGERLYREAEIIDRRQQQRRVEHLARTAAAHVPRVAPAPSSKGSPSPPRRGRPPEPASQGTPPSAGAQGQSPAADDDLAFHRPLYERADEVRRQRDERKQQLREKLHAEATPSFHPTVNQRRSASAGAGVFDRLRQWHPKHHDNPEETPQRRQPQISQTTKRLALGRDEFQRYRDWRERLLQWGQDRDRRIEHLREEAERADQPPVRVLPEEQIHETVMGLQNKAQAAKDRIAHLREEEVQGLFRPRIAPGSRRSQSVLSETCSNPEVTRRLRREDDEARLREEQAEKDRQSYTHAPVLNARSRRIAEQQRRNREGSPTPYGRNPKAKEEALRKKHEEMERQEVECTFHPRLLYYTGDDGPDYPVSGFDAYVQRATQAKQMTEERKRRAEEAHRVKRSAVAGALRQDRGGRLHTVPRPFALSTSMRHSRSGTSTTPAFPFRPATNEQGRQRVLRKVLDSESPSPAASDGDEAMSDGVPPPHSVDVAQAWSSAECEPPATAPTPGPAPLQAAPDGRRPSAIAVAAAAHGVDGPAGAIHHADPASMRLDDP
eukprot:TRINITY_DN65740_c0_g1_i1.p1 TRINITY_DN65740_c0_g1~~TRINITY_DN65740_c0_g1_i1.p1  ORF type:complete len:784 (+),score=247.67 TRINITY_DN65740_c0_g1_i1:92-2443(+)